MSEDVRNLWVRLEAWGRDNAPGMLEDLNPGASDAEISGLEGTLGLALPDSFKASLAIHNGESDGWPCKVFADRGAYLSTSGIVEQWRLRQAMNVDDYADDDAEDLIATGVIFVDGPVQPTLFRPEWVPFLECNGDVFWALDFAPADGGKAGQVIEVDWEGCSWKVIAGSFDEFLESYVADLEEGRYDLHKVGVGAAADADEDVRKSIPYRAYSLVVGYGLIALLVSAGFLRWNAVVVILIGAATQLGFQVCKRLWIYPARTWNRIEPRGLLILCAGTVVTTAFWYAAGRVLGWLTG